MDSNGFRSVCTVCLWFLQQSKDKQDWGLWLDQVVHLAVAWFKYGCWNTRIPTMSIILKDELAMFHQFTFCITSINSAISSMVTNFQDE